MTIDTANLDEARRAGRVSLAFWLSLLLAVSVYAAVALAPKLLVHATLRAEFLRQQAELVSLERRVSYLQRVRDALRNDPQFTAELARIEFDAARPGDERIAVGPVLSLQTLPAASRPTAHRATASHLPWYLPILRVLAEEDSVRMSLLAFAAAVTLGAFVFLQTPDVVPAAQTAAGSRAEAELADSGPLNRLRARYRKIADDG